MQVTGATTVMRAFNCYNWFPATVFWVTICFYCVITLVRILLFIEWVLLNSQRLCYVINRGSNMSGHSILNLLNELVKLILCEALPSTISFLPTSLVL